VPANTRFFFRDGLVAIPARSPMKRRRLSLCGSDRLACVFEDARSFPEKRFFFSHRRRIDFRVAASVLAGLRVIITSSSDAKLTQREPWRAPDINYKATPGLGEEARKLSGGEALITSSK